MKQTALTGFLVVAGIVAGVALVEMGLRIFKPDLLNGITSQQAYRTPAALVYAPNDTFIAKPAEGAETQEIALNQYGLRDSRDIADATPEDWVVYGGSVAFGLGASMDEWFGNLYEEEGRPAVYNAALVGGSRYFKPMVEQVFELGTEAGRAVFVVDMGLPPEVLRNQLDSFDAQPEGQADEGKGSFLQGFALARAMGLSSPPEPDIPEAFSLGEAAGIVRGLKPAILPYASTRERNVVLLLPARGYWLDNAYGTAHRQNQEAMGRALRALNNVYVVDLSYMMRQNRANPLEFYYDNGHLKPEGQRILATGWARQVGVFNDWRPLDELDPEEREKVLKQMEENRLKQEERRKKNIFE